VNQARGNHACFLLAQGVDLRRSVPVTTGAERGESLVNIESDDLLGLETTAA